MADVENHLRATELRLGLPGSDSDSEETATVTAQLLKGAAGMMMMTMTPPTTPRGSKRALLVGGGLELSGRQDEEDEEEEEAAKTNAAAAPPAAKAQVVGWPPVRSYRKSCFQASSKQSKAAPAPAPAPAKKQEETATATAAGLYVKVSMDGAPYLRKIDLKMYKGYRELREALEAMFLCFSGDNNSSSAAAGAAANVNPSDFAVTYEDKDGDLMLVGDVPFEMFMSTCKRLRIMKGSEARGLGGSSKE